MGCPFCQIVAGEVDATVVYENEHVVAFRDINPQAPTHILIVPREHIDGPLAFDNGNAELAGKLVAAAATIARQEGVADDGYRLVLNQGQDGGQSVFHVHLHLLAGRRLRWPPG